MNKQSAERGLHAIRLSKAYGDRVILHPLSLTVKPGTIVGLFGPNGAGKTTTFLLLAGLTPSDTGALYMDEVDLASLPLHERARKGLGYLPQESSIFEQLTVYQNIFGALEYRTNYAHTERCQKTEALLAEFHLQALRDRPGKALSGGERRRVEIARLLTIEPKYMLLDEPFAGIDPISIDQIKRILLRLTERGMGVLITDHNVHATLGFCQHAYVIGSGKLITAGTPEAIINHRWVREIYLGDQFQL